MIYYSHKHTLLQQWEKQAALEVDPTYCIIHAMVKGLVLGEETTRSIWGVGELGAMDEIMHRGTSSTSSNSTTRGVPVREVKVPLAVVTVALKDKRTSAFCQEANCSLALLTSLMNPYCCKKLSFQSGYITGYTHSTFFYCYLTFIRAMSLQHFKTGSAENSPWGCFFV